MFQGLFIDGFAGGGGASTGIAWAIGRDPDIAVNHSETALAIHRANHPDTEHHCTDIRMPFLAKQTTRGRPVAGAWFSPDCKEFSKAKGGPVKDRSIRALCWEVVAWLKDTRPTCGYLENVEEFEYAAPLDDEGRPIAGAEGREFKRFVKSIRALGYRVQWKVLIACHYGAPTSRKRLYMVMRNDGKPIVWPKPTHGAPDSPGVRSGRLLPYRTAAECIDWSIPCPSIFDRKRELADATKRRIAHGVMRYVVNAAKPFIVGTAFTNTRASRVFDPADPLRTATTQPEYGVVDAEIAPFTIAGQHGGKLRRADEVHRTVAASGKDTNGVVEVALAPHVMTNRNAQKPFTAGNEPTHTITAGGAHQNVVAATLATLAHGERRPGEQPRMAELGDPLGTTHAGGGNHAAVTAFLSSFYGKTAPGDAGAPAPSSTTRSKQSVVAAHMAQFNTNPNGTVNDGHDMRETVSTIATRGPHQGVVETTLVEEGMLPPAMLERATMVAAFLVKYYGEGGQSQRANVPLDVITTKARYAVVTVTIDAVTYVIVDIGLRMLKPRELARAQGFPENYILNPVVRKFIRGKWVERQLTIAEQISAIGNSVCPPVARALVLANQPGLNGNLQPTPDFAMAA